MSGFETTHWSTVLAANSQSTGRARSIPLFVEV